MSTVNPQGELALLGCSTRPKYPHPTQEIGICASMSDAVALSLRHARMTQEMIADCLNVSAGYLSMLMIGKRPWQQKHLELIRHHTGSLATLQFSAMREGVEVYADPVKVRLAQIEQEREALLRAAA